MKRTVQNLGAVLLCGLCAAACADVQSPLGGTCVDGARRDVPSGGKRGLAESRASACQGEKSCNLLKGFFGGRRERDWRGGDEGGLKSLACEDADTREIARLTVQARTAGRGEDRSAAVEGLGEFGRQGRPEVLAALIYSLSDADAGVRAAAADSIGSLIEEGRCGPSPEVTAALTCAFADCDEGVRDEAEDALDVCGYGTTARRRGDAGAGTRGVDFGTLSTPVATGPDKMSRANSLNIMFGLRN